MRLWELCASVAMFRVARKLLWRKTKESRTEVCQSRYRYQKIPVPFSGIGSRIELVSTETAGFLGSGRRGFRRRCAMFDTLDDQMKQDDQAASSLAARFVPWAIGILATVVVLGGLYLAMKSLG